MVRRNRQAAEQGVCQIWKTGCFEPPDFVFLFYAGEATSPLRNRGFATIEWKCTCNHRACPRFIGGGARCVSNPNLSPKWGEQVLYRITLWLIPIPNFIYALSWLSKAGNASFRNSTKKRCTNILPALSPTKSRQ